MQTPRPKSYPGFECRFSDLDTHVCRIAPKMYSFFYGCWVISPSIVEIDRWPYKKFYSISKNSLFYNSEENAKVIQNPYMGLDHQHQKLTTSRGSTLAHAYHVWSTSVNKFESYTAHRQNDRNTKNNHHCASLDSVIIMTVNSNATSH